MIFPDWGTVPQEKQAGQELPLYREWAVDPDTGAFALRDGKPYLVEGAEALKLWVACALHPDSRRFCLTAHSHDYGNELDTLLGHCPDAGIVESLLQKTIEDALLASPYIEAVDSFRFQRSGSRVEAAFTVHTVYEEFAQKTEVTIG